MGGTGTRVNKRATLPKSRSVGQPQQEEGQTEAKRTGWLFAHNSGLDPAKVAGHTEYRLLKPGAVHYPAKGGKNEAFTCIDALHFNDGNDSECSDLRYLESDCGYLDLGEESE
jgi:hypothetical protein